MAATILNLIALAMAEVALLVVELFAGPLAGLLSDRPNPNYERVLRNCLRIIAPAVLLFGLTGGTTDLLYALRRFDYTAVGGAIGCRHPDAAARLAVRHLRAPPGHCDGQPAAAAVVGWGAQDWRLRFSTAWRHPAVRRIGRLYLPIALGLDDFVQIIVDGRWASAARHLGVSWMGYATNLIQLPLGLIPVAISWPHPRSRSGRPRGLGRLPFIFGRGLRLVLVLLLPAAVGLWALARPIIRLLFQHGSFVDADTVMTCARFAST